MKKRLFLVLVSICLFMLMTVCVAAKQPVVWNFDNNSTQGWKSNVDGTLSAENGALKQLIHTSNNDVFIYVDGLNVDTSAYKYAILDIKHNVPQSNWGSEPFYFLFKETNSSWSADMLLQANRKGALNQYERYVFTLSSNYWWKYYDTVAKFRFDAFATTASNLGDYVVWIDNVIISYDVNLTFDYGFADMQNSTETIIAGIDVSLSDYAEPTKSGYDFSGWVDADGNKVETINANEDTTVYATWIETGLASEFVWDFNNNTTQGWESNVDGTLSAENGALKLLIHNTNGDVYIYTQGLNIDTSVYKYAVMDVKHNVPQANWGPSPFYFLFYNTNNSWWANMLVTAETKPASEQYERYVFDLGSNVYWNGTMARLRFDAFDTTAPNLGDYVVWIDNIMLSYGVDITFDYGFDHMQNSTETVMAGTEISFADYTAPTMDGYRFTGWVDANGNKLETIIINKDLTVYASWVSTEPAIILTESSVSVFNLETDAVLVLSGYDFDGRVTDTVKIPVSAAIELDFDETGLDLLKCREIKAFLFEDMVGLKPMCKEKSTLRYMLDYEELEEGTVGLMGRWFDYEFTDGNLYKTTITPGSEMYFKVSGTTKVKIKVRDKDGNWQNPPYVAVSVDGGAPVRVVTVKNAEATLVSGLDPETEHIIRITVDSFDSAHGGRWPSGSGGLIFDKIAIDAGGTITGLMPKNPIIAYYGDSITEGLASLSSAGQGMLTTSSSAVNAYPFIASHLVGAVSHTSGYGSTGIKVVAGLGNVPDCITVIDNMIQDTPIVMPELDAIVINHGHNDLNFGVSNAAFAEGYKEVLERLREKHPGVPIMAVVPYAQRYVETIREVVEEMNDDRIYYISTAGWEYTTYDGVHPNAAGAQKLGTRLAVEIERVLADVKAQEEN